MNSLYQNKKKPKVLCVGKSHLSFFSYNFLWNFIRLLSVEMEYVRELFKSPPVLTWPFLFLFSKWQIAGTKATEITPFLSISLCSFQHWLKLNLNVSNELKRKFISTLFFSLLLLCVVYVICFVSFRFLRSMLFSVCTNNYTFLSIYIHFLIDWTMLLFLCLGRVQPLHQLCENFRFYCCFFTFTMNNDDDNNNNSPKKSTHKWF